MGHGGKPLISIITPVFNTESYLDDCISSVLSQTLSDFELILIDDGSTDNSKALCEQLCQEDERIRLVSYDNNHGVSHARNTGINLAVGKYLFFLDSDDMIHPQLLEEGVKQAEKSEADMLINDFFYSNRNPDGVWEDFCNNLLDADWHILSGDEVWEKWFGLHRRDSIGGKLFLKEAVQNLHFDEQIDCAEDVLFNYSFLTDKPRTIIYTNTPGYYYRVRNDSLWGGRNLDEMSLTIKIRHGIIDSELKAGRKKNAVLEKEKCISLIETFYVLFGKNDKTSAIGTKKLLKKEKSDALFKEISARRKCMLFLAMNFPSLYMTLKSLRGR